MAASYEKWGWKDGGLYVNQAGLEHMEDGIIAAIEGISDQADQLQDINTKLAIINEIYSPDLLNSYEAIQTVVRNGVASKVFAIGDQINVPYTWDGVEYTWPFDIVDFQDVELEDGSTVPGMVLQPHTATPVSMMFSQRNAFYVCRENLLPGTYYVICGGSSGVTVSGDIFQFTLTQTVPIGGQLALSGEVYSTLLTSRSVRSYESNSATSYIESVSITMPASEDEADGTCLGSLIAADYDMENGVMGTVGHMSLGNNNWPLSAYRQWLNSKAAAGEWFTPQHDFDRPVDSTYLNYAGFMSGFSDDFLNILKPVKVATAKNTSCFDGSTEYTYDTFFLTSLQQQFIKPQVSDVEGTAFEYWQKIGGGTQYPATNSAGIYPIFYSLNAGTACTVRLRSCNRSNTYNVWCVGSAGAVNSSGATNAYRSVPACVVC